MTSERLHVIEMADIRGIEVRCRNEKCTARVVVAPGLDQQVPASCAVCGHALFDPQKSSWSFAEQLRSAIGALLKSQVNNIRIEVVGVETK